MTKFLKSMAVAAAFLIAGAASAQDVVVLESDAAALAPGSVVAESQAVDIPAGAQVTLIMANGETRAVLGPYAGPIGQATSAEVGGRALASDTGADTKVLGAVRAPKWETDN